jgi:hypothetical protein
MKKQDPALRFAHPRLLAAFYFGLLSIIGTIIIDSALSVIEFEELVPIFHAVILGVIVSACCGALFGESIVHCPKPYKAKTFWLGFSMVIASLPLFALGLVFLMDDIHKPLFITATLTDYIIFYLVVLAYGYILFGIILAIAAGLAAMYLRGQLVYDILNTQEHRQRKKRTQPLEHKKQASNRVRSLPH